MYPVSTSFIPINVAFAKFIESHGFDGNYSLWYLGVVPVKYLMGPVVPWVLVLLHKLLPGFSFFDLSFLLLIASYLLQAIGWGFLAFKLSGQKRIGQVVFALSLVLPWHIFYSMAFGEVSSVLASALTPWVLVAYATVKSEKWKVKSFLTSISITILFLTNTTASIPAIVGILILGLIKDKNWEKGLKNALTVIIVGWFLSLFWYGPGYWLTIWGAPSFGSRNTGESLIWLLTLLRGFVPVFLAVFVVVFGLRRRSLFEKFALSWLVSFGFLTLVRFWANPSFWLDWTAWIGEVEVGLALLFASWIYDLRFTIYDLKTKIFLNPKSLIIILLLVGGWLVAFVNRQLWLPRISIDDRVEYQIAQELKKVVKPDEIVFLSGTTAFWLNSLSDIKQIRGGRDEVAGGSSWRELAWEVRSGTNPHKSYEMLQTLGVDWMVVHTDDSKEFYHDFEFPQKFETVSQFQKIYEGNGNIIYKIKE